MIRESSSPHSYLNTIYPLFPSLVLFLFFSFSYFRTSPPKGHSSVKQTLLFSSASRMRIARPPRSAFATLRSFCVSSEVPFSSLHTRVLSLAASAFPSLVVLTVRTHFVPSVCRRRHTPTDCDE